MERKNIHTRRLWKMLLHFSLSGNPTSTLRALCLWVCVCVWNCRCFLFHFLHSVDSRQHSFLLKTRVFIPRFSVFHIKPFFFLLFVHCRIVRIFFQYSNIYFRAIYLNLLANPDEDIFRPALYTWMKLSVYVCAHTCACVSATIIKKDIWKLQK